MAAKKIPTSNKAHVAAAGASIGGAATWAINHFGGLGLSPDDLMMMTVLVSAALAWVGAYWTSYFPVPRP